MANLPTGATLTLISASSTPNGQYFLAKITGTYTAADFTVNQANGLGFTPSKVRVCNLTDRVEATKVTGITNSLVSVAAGTRTYADSGIAIGNRSVTVTVATIGLMTDNDDILVEAWG